MDYKEYKARETMKWIMLISFLLITVWAYYDERVWELIKEILGWGLKILYAIYKLRIFSIVFEYAPEFMF